jgi:DNA modification methylase
VSVSLETTIPQIAFNHPLKPDQLNIDIKSRSNLFTWRGQFTPQLVENLLAAYGPEKGCILDPFMGSGTVLVEAARVGLRVEGSEINPAAFLLASTYIFINLNVTDRNSFLSEAEQILEPLFNDSTPLFQSTFLDSGNSIEEKFIKALYQAQNKEVHQLITTLSLSVDFAYKAVSPAIVWNNWVRLKQLVKELPFSRQTVSAHLADARSLPLEDNTVDFVLTSPPYINVFNYHQNYRKSVETLGWRPLEAAVTEIGANRKFRQNRLLTVVQYCIDMALVLLELQRVCKPETKVIFVVGRESNVRKTSFFNSDLIQSLAAKVLRYDIAQIQERVFKNKFGQSIYEDLIHLVVPQESISRDTAILKARDIARNALEEAKNRAPLESIKDLEVAIDYINKVEPSKEVEVNRP